MIVILGLWSSGQALVNFERRLKMHYNQAITHELKLKSDSFFCQHTWSRIDVNRKQFCIQESWVACGQVVKQLPI